MYRSSDTSIVGGRGERGELYEGPPPPSHRTTKHFPLGQPQVVNKVRGQLTKLQRKTLSALIVIDVHARDVVQELASLVGGPRVGMDGKPMLYAPPIHIYSYFQYEYEYEYEIGCTCTRAKSTKLVASTSKTGRAATTPPTPPPVPRHNSLNPTLLPRRPLLRARAAGHPERDRL